VADSHFNIAVALPFAPRCRFILTSSSHLEQENRQEGSDEETDSQPSDDAV
jgi:hypothetical protein